MKLLMPVDGMFQLHYVVNLTYDDLCKIGRALARLGAKKCDGNHGGPPCADPKCWAADDGDVRRG